MKDRIIHINTDGTISGQNLCDFTNPPSRKFSYVLIENSEGSKLFAVSNKDGCQNSTNPNIHVGHSSLAYYAKQSVPDGHIISVGEFQLAQCHPYKISTVTNKSGHFFPSKSSNEQFRNFLNTQITPPYDISCVCWGQNELGESEKWYTDTFTVGSV